MAIFIYSEPLSLQTILPALNLCLPTIDANKFVSSESVKHSNNDSLSKPLWDNVFGDEPFPQTVLIPSIYFNGSRFFLLLSMTTTSFSSDDSSLATLLPIEPPPKIMIFNLNSPQVKL